MNSFQSRISWRENLAAFLQHSNEDEIYVEHLPPVLLLLAQGRRSGALTAIDLGCGPATKIIGILERIERSGVQTRAWLVDRDEFWAEDVRGAVEGSALKHQIQICIPQDCLDFVRSVSEPIDILLSTHMIYDRESEDRLVQSCASLLPKGTVAIVSTESQNSCLAEIRNEIEGRFGIHMPHGDLLTVRERLREAGFETIVFQLQDQYLRLPELRSSSGLGWYIDLILGRPSGDLDPLLYQKVFDLVLDHLSSFASGTIAIPDDVMIAWSQSGIRLRSLDQEMVSTLQDSGNDLAKNWCK